jgi:chemotaxis protein CheX
VPVLLNGVRKAAIATAQRGGGKGMEPTTMAVSLRESLQQVSDPRNLDASVEEVFQLMLGVNCRRDNDLVKGNGAEPESVTSVVGFGGLLSGACVFSCGSGAAMKIAGHMLGMEFKEIDDTVKDGIGEICNMLAGAWKGKVPELAANCGLSVPAVITGRDYKLHVQAPEFQLHHRYTFESHSFAVTIVCDGLQ